MPMTRVPSNDFISYSGSNYFCYDQPPGPDRYWHCEEGEGDILPSKRKSWIDVVDQCSEHNAERISTITDLSSLADSRQSACSQTSCNGVRRRSWEQLIEENEENGQIDNSIDLIGSPAPVVQSQLPLPYANPALHMMTVREDGRLARVHLYNKRRSSANSEKTGIENETGLKSQGSKREGSSGSSKTSTMSEFILVPSKTAYASSSSSSIGDDCRFQHEYGKLKKRPLTSYVCPWSPSRRTVFVMVLTMALLLTSAVGGYVLRRFIVGRRTVYELTFPTNRDNSLSDQSTVTLRLVVDEPNNAEFSLDGSLPYQRVKTIMDFDKKLVLSRNSALPSYCFASTLDTSSFPTIDAVKEAAENALSTGPPAAGMGLEDWHWRQERVGEDLRDTFKLGEEWRSQCEVIYWVQRTDKDNAAVKCAECTSVCLPSYSRTGSGPPVLTVVGRDCFWLSPATNPLASTTNPIVNKDRSFLPATNFLRPPLYQQHRQMDSLQSGQTSFFVYPNQQNGYNPFPASSNYGQTNFFRRPS